MPHLTIFQQHEFYLSETALTYYNQMPLMVEGLAKANNINCEVKSITASSYKLTQFATTGNAYNNRNC